MKRFRLDGVADEVDRAAEQQQAEREEDEDSFDAQLTGEMNKLVDGFFKTVTTADTHEGDEEAAGGSADKPTAKRKPKWKKAKFLVPVSCGEEEAVKDDYDDELCFLLAHGGGLEDETDSRSKRDAILLRAMPYVS